MRSARLVYKKVQSGTEYNGADIVVRAYMNAGNLCADVIHTLNNARKVDRFTNASPTLLAEAAADFANQRMIDTDIILCSNDLPNSTQRHPDCANQFKVAFVAEIEALTDTARSIKEAEARSAAYVEDKFGDWKRRRIAEAKKKIFGTE